jgi:hypothetical protein
VSCYVIVNTSQSNFTICFSNVLFFVERIVKSRRVTKTRRVGCHCEEVSGKDVSLHYSLMAMIKLESLNILINL